MANEKYYRSPIDELVVKSGLPATAIADQMGIKYHRMVALRRVKSVQDVDLALCATAIEALKTQEIKYKKRGRPKNATILHAKPKVTDSVIKLPDSVKPETVSLAFLLGQSLIMLDQLLKFIEAHGHHVSDGFIKNKKELEVKADKLLFG